MNGVEDKVTKNVIATIDYFDTYSLNAFVLVTNAPGRSAFNRLERNRPSQ